MSKYLFHPATPIFSVGAGWLLASGAGMGAYIYNPNNGGISITIGLLRFISRTSIGWVVFWPEGLAGSLLTILAFIALRNHSALEKRLFLLTLPTSYLIGITVGVLSTLKSGHFPNVPPL